MACHAVRSMKVGPSFEALGRKYKDGPDGLVADLRASKDHADVARITENDDFKQIASWIGAM